MKTEYNPRMRGRGFLSLALFLGVAIGSSVATSAATDPTPDSSASHWVDQLGDSDQQTRDSAERMLTDAGKQAVPLLKSALADPQPEVRTRARRALRKIQLFLLPGVPDAALSAASEYLAANNIVIRKFALNKLFNLHPQPDAVLTRLVPLEDDDDLRRQILYQLAEGYRPALARMLVDDEDLPGVLCVLNQSAQMWGKAEAADDAAALFLTGNLDGEIAIAQAEQTNGESAAQERSATRLCYMYRVCGKYDQAMKFARLAHDQSLVFLVLQDMGDWSAAAKEPDSRWRDPLVAAGYRSAFTRLAGHRQAAQDILSPLAAHAPSDTDRFLSTSRIFLLNDLPQRGMELAETQSPAAVFEMRVERGELEEAREIARRYKDHPDDAKPLATLLAALDESLGESQASATEPTTQMSVPADPVEDVPRAQALPSAEALAAIWDKDHTRLDALFLEGYSLAGSAKSAAETDRAKSLMRDARLLSLGDPEARCQFAEQLQLAGLIDEPDQQVDLALRTGADFDEVGFCQVENLRRVVAAQRKQWHTAADAADRLCLMSLSPQVKWKQASWMLIAPADAHLLKARQALENHDLPEMDAELRMYQQYLPMSADMVLEMIPALDEVGEHARADELFDGVYAKLAEICQKYPRSGQYLNSLAWMCACCDRKLDEGLKAAQTNVQLQPNNWQVLDTLAEMRFRRGDRAGALSLEKQVSRISSDAYVARQLKRFEKGEIPSTTQPGPAPD